MGEQGDRGWMVQGWVKVRELMEAAGMCTHLHTKGCNPACERQLRYQLFNL